MDSEEQERQKRLIEYQAGEALSTIRRIRELFRPIDDKDEYLELLNDAYGRLADFRKAILGSLIK